MLLVKLCINLVLSTVIIIPWPIYFEDVQSTYTYGIARVWTCVLMLTFPLLLVDMPLHVTMDCTEIPNPNGLI